MPHRVQRRRTDYDDAVQILRGLKDRIEQLEEDDRGGQKTVQLSRTAVDTTTCTDSVSRTVGDAGGFTFNESNWGFDEFANTR